MLYHIFMRFIGLDHLIKFMDITNLRSLPKTRKELCKGLGVNELTLKKKLEKFGLEVIQIILIVKKVK